MSNDDKPSGVPRLRTEDLEDPFAPSSSPMTDGASLPGDAASQDTTADLVSDEQPAPPVSMDGPAPVISPSEPTAAGGGDTVTLLAPNPLLQQPKGPQLTRTHLEDLGVFARGGFGAIHKVRDTRLSRIVAMKVLDTPEDRARLRFLQEGQVTAQLSHPNVVPVHEAGSRESKPFFTMQLVRGDTLTRVLQKADLEQDTARELHRILDIFLRVCDALSFAHARGVIHRDLKPDNIMVGGFGQVYVMDWGIALVRGTPGRDGPVPDVAMVQLRRDANAAATDRAGTVVGTPSYMAPEQAQGRLSAIDERTDVFALGGILYFILTGTAPYTGKNSQEKLLKAQAAQLEKPELRAPHRRIPPGLRQIALKALAEDAAARYQTVSALKEDIELFLRGGWWFETRTFVPGEVIIHEGDEADTAFIITGGTAEAYRGEGDDERVLSRMGPGDVFGETAILTDSARSASVRAVSPLSAMVVTRESVEDQFSSDSWMGQIVSTLAKRFKEMERLARQPGAAAPKPDDDVRPAMAPGRKLPRVTLPSRRLDAEARSGEGEAVAGGEKNPFGDEQGSILESATMPLLLDLLGGAGELSEAAALYERSEGDLGPVLLEWAEQSAVPARRRLARMLELARDFESAGRAYELADDFDNAARLFDRGGAHDRAARCYLLQGDRAAAASAFERAELVDEALQVYRDAAMPREEAALLVRAGRFFDAAEVLHTLGDLAAEVSMLRRVPLHDGHRVKAALRLSSLMVASQQFEEAVHLLSDTLTAWNDPSTSSVVGEALMNVFRSMGRPEDAERIREWIAEQVQERLPDDRDEPDTDLDVKADADHATGEILHALQSTKLHPDAYTRLKDLPLFAELSRDELKDVFVLIEETRFPKGERIIERGEAVGGLYVLLEGDAEVLVGDDAEKPINVVGPGDTLGEISLLRGGAGTARVVALDDVRALFLPQARLEEYLLRHPTAATEMYRHLATQLAKRVGALSR
jgi:serine/threonine-protein kinase